MSHLKFRREAARSLLSLGSDRTTRRGPIKASAMLVRCDRINHFLEASFKKFYKNVTVAGTSNYYEINLDHRKLKTPGGKILQIPSYALALGVASEWQSIDEKIVPPWMHLTSLSNTVADNPQSLSKLDVIEKILHFLPTDTLLFKNDSAEDMLRLQNEQWNPVLDWFNRKFDSLLESSVGLYPPDVTQCTKDVLINYFSSYNDWSLFGILYAVEVIKSVILTLASVERWLEPNQAVRLSLLETEYQISRWGKINWAHEQDKLDILSRFSAAVMFVHLNSSNYFAKKKISRS